MNNLVCLGKMYHVYLKYIAANFYIFLIHASLTNSCHCIFDMHNGKIKYLHLTPCVRKIFAVRVNSKLSNRTRGIFFAGVAAIK